MFPIAWRPVAPLLIAICAASFLVPASTLGATITVTTTADELDAPASQNGACSLREAVFSIDQGSNYFGAMPDCVATGPAYGTQDTISLGSNTYELTLPPVLNPEGNFDGDLDVFKSMSIVGTGDGPGGTVIDANGIDRAIDVRPIATSPEVTVRGLTITGGDTPDDGGAIRVADPDAGIVVEEATIRDSHSGGLGGGIAYRDAAFTGPISDFGIQASEVIGNTADDSGGGVYFSSVTASTFVDVKNSLVAGNSAGSGGGLYVGGVGPISNLDLANTTLSGNTASVSGGAIEIAPGTMTELTFATVVGNTTPAAGGGGGIHGSGAAASGEYQSSLFAFNSAAGAPSNCAGTTVLLDEGRNIESANTCGFAAGSPELNLLNTDPRLAPLADNGGDTRTHGLYDGSPAIDLSHCGGSFGSDQRYVSRPGGRPDVLGCDSGAFEGSVGPAPVAPVVTSSTTLPGSPGTTTKKKCKKDKKLKKGTTRPSRKCVKKKRKKK